ncbi:hypothetical protein AMJ44_06950 [candidate division WOR-1 bacterium DG_54_3]|uniref:Uncharacterized protein n=1 Tax=candidate division WOR-1 bacterium DG_54_3 TaxID=1703775 RepID=A0A0S7XZN0_UNCSA|nr:MAG: hypothetical protein AMJ44_06950 [candidate division WOR-1 bacterium DG_54_3]
MKNTYDVIIVGAGPAGSTAARFIAAKGFKVLVLEKAKLDREKACAGGITERAIKEFGIPEKAFDRMIYGGLICSPKNVALILEESYRRSASAMRGKFDKTLCEMAMKEGAQFKEESKVIEPVFMDKNLIGVKSMEKGKVREYRARVTVVADGCPSNLARKLGVYIGDPHAIFAGYQHQLKLKNSEIDKRIDNRIEIYYGSDFFPEGYAWIFPKNGLVSVGLVIPLYIIEKQRINLKKRLDNFIKDHPIVKDKLRGAEILFSQGALIPFGGLGEDKFKIVSRIYGNGYVIVGDAAGFVSPLTGEGIYYGMKSAQLAAEVVSESLKLNDFSEKALAKYYRKIRESIIYGDMKEGWKLKRIFDKNIEKIIRASKADPWFKEINRELFEGEISYPKYLKALYLHPVKLFRMLFFY